uniref:NAF domain-containing protein n=1 Tax=Arundo donax TaxID=35708 RepID=A0A0A9FNN0_ARUDO
MRCILNPDTDTRIHTDGILSHPWFRDGASDDEVACLMRGHEEEAWFKPECKEDMARDMTAFDILSFSPGSDLSGLFGAGPGKERVFVGEPAAAVLRRVEDAGRKEGYGVRREGKKGAGPVYVERESGGIVAKVSVFKLADAVSVVEVVKGDGAEAALFWTDRLEPAVKPRALS